MKELLDFAIHNVNIIPTALLVFVAAYWVIVIIGLIDLGAIDIDLDLDLDVDVDVDVDVNTEVNLGNSIGWFNQILVFFNLGHIPLMFFLSFLALPLWFISIVVNDFIGNSSFIFSLILLIPNFIVSLFIAKFLTLPFVKFFSRVDQSTESVSVIGKVCTVLLETDHDSVGQAEINESGTSLRINVRTSKGTVLKKGESALVIDHSDGKNVFLIEPYNN